MIDVVVTFTDPAPWELEATEPLLTAMRGNSANSHLPRKNGCTCYPNQIVNNGGVLSTDYRPTRPIACWNSPRAAAAYTSLTPYAV